MAELEPLIGRTIAGRYRVTDMIGVGGMGAVYAAVQEPLGRSVALKVLKASFARDDVAVARFNREAQIISQLSHPNIVTLHDFGATDDGLLFIVMEHLRGSTLGTMLRSRGPMPWQRTLPLVKDVVRALSAAHAVGVIHRDLKLDNIMLVADGERDLVKVLDFGVAKTLASQRDDVALTETDSSPGTPGYMSPELARGITTDPRSDFYALGVVWFELLVGHRPFTDKNAMDLFLHQMTRTPPRVRDVAPQAKVPENIDALIHRMLAREAADRPAHTAELLEALFGIEDELPTDPRRRRSTSGDAIPRLPLTARDTPRDLPAPPTVGDVMLPTQVGSPPPFTDVRVEALRAAASKSSAVVDEEANIATIPATRPMVPPSALVAPTVPGAPASMLSLPDVSTSPPTSPTLAPAAIAQALAQAGSAASADAAAIYEPGVVTQVAAQMANAQSRSRAPLLAAVISVAAAIVAIVALRPTRSLDEAAHDAALEASARGPFVYQVRVASGAPGGKDRDDVIGAPLVAKTITSASKMSTTAARVDEAAPAMVSAALSSPPPVAAVATGTTATAAEAELAGGIVVTGARKDEIVQRHIVEVRDRFGVIATQMRDRLLLPDDVPRYRSLAAEITKAIDDGRADAADAALRELEGALASLRITDAFIRAKTKRVEANFPAGWPRTDAQRAELAKLRADVAERFGAGDLPGANYALNRLWLFSLKARQARD